MSLISLLPFLITAVGFYFLLKLRFFFIRHPVNTLFSLKRALGSRSAFRALTLSLAGTLGVGNIVGVAFGISVGGAGSLFWMLISSVFASVIKYSESLLSSDMSVGDHGGMMYVIRRVFKRIGVPMSKIYAVLCLLLSLFMGAALQSNSAVGAARESLEMSPALFAAIFTALAAAFIFYGRDRIDGVTSVIIPIAAVLYILLCAFIIADNFSRLPIVATDIINGAFTPKGIGGGAVGSGIIITLKEGFARGLLSNEAGAGTSAMAQSRNSDAHPAAVGLLGMCEVAFDTALLCMLTGFSVLLALPAIPEGASGIEIVISAVGSILPSSAAYIVFALILLFAYSTVICWYFYGGECVYYLTGKALSSLYSAVFLAAVFSGYYLSDRFLITVTDYLLFFMTVMTLLAILKSSERIVSLSEQYKLLKK